MTNKENEVQKKTRSEATEQALKTGEELFFTDCPHCKQLLAVYISTQLTPPAVLPSQVN